jgi:predicted nucleic acid-binding protein
VTLALDSWVILAWLKDQAPGAGVMAGLWEQAEAGRAQLVMNIVNLGEVFYIVAKARGEASARTVLQNLQGRRIEIASASDELVLEAATLKARYPISYADAFAAATALGRGAPLVTGDPEMRGLSGEGLRLEWAGTR